MAERLGEALLDLRTNDAGFVAGVTRAEGQAQRLGSTLDKTKGSSAQLATEMTRTGQSAARMSAGFEAAGQRVGASVTAQRAGMQQLSFQIGDIATMYSLGARPAQIFASQIGQVTQAVQMMSGGTSRVAAFLGGPWGMALTAATIVLAPFVSKLFESEQALEQVKLASDNLKDSQNVLSRIFDLTTGKLKEQSAQAKETAASLLELSIVQAEGRQRRAREGLQDASGRTVSVGEYVADGSRAGMSFRTSERRTVSAVAAQRALNGDTTGALRYLREQRDAGRLSGALYEQVATQIHNIQIEGRNIEGARAGLQSIATGKLDPRFREGGGAPRGRTGGTAGGTRVRSEAEKVQDFDNQSLNLEREVLQARLSLATSAEERADVQLQLLDLDREQRIAEIEASDLGADRKAALIAQVEALLGVAPKIDEQGNLILSANRGIEGQIISRERQRQQAFDEMELADTRLRGELEMLQNQMALADTQAAQKVIALRIYDTQVEEERLRLQKIIDLEAIGAVTKKEADDARARLAALNANAASGRAAVGLQNETDVERYLRGLNKTPGQINEALDGIKIDGLEALNDGITDAILGAESLGDVFDNVADQIIAALLRIAIQQAIIRPLANALFGGEGGGGGGGGLFDIFSPLRSFFGSFAGGRATGGPIPTGSWAIVGEEGPELAYAGPGGVGIFSNSDSRKMLSGGAGGGTSIAIPISIDATGADAAALERVRAQLAQLQAELPGRIVTTVQEAKDRRILNLGGGR
jgi:hypothetical protein